MSGYDELAKRLRNPALIATREESAEAIEALQAEVERLKWGLKQIADGDVPREAVTIWRTDGIHSKHDKCEHMRVMYDDCGNCISDFARSALEAKP